MTKYFYNFVLKNKEYILFKIQLFGSICYGCLEKNINGTYNLTNYDIHGTWKWIAPGGLIKEWLFYTCFEFIGNVDVEYIKELTNKYDDILALPYEIINSIKIN